MVENGYIAIGADALYQGNSEGTPRSLDIPSSRVEDIHRMADIISNFPCVDDRRLGVLGICGGGGYTAKAAQTDKRFQAVTTLSLFNSGIVRRNGFLNQQSQMNVIRQKLEDASAARVAEARGEMPGVICHTSKVR